jgi:hypothetical protein
MAAVMPSTCHASAVSKHTMLTGHHHISLFKHTEAHTARRVHLLP